MESKTRNCATCPSRIDSIFCSLPQQFLAELSRHKTTNRYKRGQNLFYEGNPPIGIYCISNGKIKVFKNGTDGKEVILRISQHGDVLGYWSVLGDKPHDATAEVIEESDVCFVDKKFIQYLIEHDQATALQVIRKLGQDLENVESRLSDIMNLDVRHRFLRLLVALQKSYGVKEKDGTWLDIRLSRNEMGAMVGATPETVIRLLSSLEEEGMLKLEGKKITIADTEALFREASQDN